MEKKMLHMEAPNLISEFDAEENAPLDVFSLSSQSGKRVWWRCQEGHRWQSKVSHRVNGSNCPYCSGKLPIVGKTDLATVCPLLVAEWHDTNPPQNYTAGSSYKANWKCKEGHEWRSAIYSRVRTGVGCPYCSGRLPVKGINDLATVHPQLALEWHPTKNTDLQPSMVTAGSSKKVWWQCAQGHEWETIVNTRTSGNSGCPYCSGRFAISGKTDLLTIAPEIADQWHPTKNGDMTPSQVTSRSGQKVWWLCKNSHEWQAVIGSRTAGNGCPQCANTPSRWVNPGENDLASQNPVLAKEWSPNNDFSPHEVSQFSERQVEWQCSSGHTWMATVCARSQGTGCPKCRFAVVAGVNDFASSNQNIISEWHPTKNLPLLPEEIRIFSHKQAWWICQNNHEWQAPVERRSAGSGCPQCREFITSKAEREIAAVISALGFEVVQNSRRIIPPKELDIYIPSQKFAIEFNGVYWHSEAAGKDRNYHLTKYLACKKAGIRLFQVWEDDWRDRKEIILRSIIHRLGKTISLDDQPNNTLSLPTSKFMARKGTIKQSSYSDLKVFFEENHIQGMAKGSLYLTLKDSDQSIRAALIAKQISKQQNAWSIERYATSGIVQGGFTKLLKALDKLATPSRLITFSDHSISDGGLYEHNGFTVDKILPPDYSYLVNGKRVHKFNYRLKRFREDPNLLFEEGLTESQLAALNNLTRIWDSGKTRWVKAMTQS